MGNLLKIKRRMVVNFYNILANKNSLCTVIQGMLPKINTYMIRALDHGTMGSSNDPPVTNKRPSTPRPMAGQYEGHPGVLIHLRLMSSCNPFGPHCNTTITTRSWGSSRRPKKQAGAELKKKKRILSPKFGKHLRIMSRI